MTNANTNFEDFMKAVNEKIAQLTGGLDSFDLPDYNYRDAFDSNWTPGKPHGPLLFMRRRSNASSHSYRTKR